MTMNKPPIQAKFERFNLSYPHIFKLFVQFAWEARTAGLAKHSADAILHRIRWHLYVENWSLTNVKVKINDHYSSRYARKLIEHDPTFKTFFELRTLTSCR